MPPLTYKCATGDADGRTERGRSDDGVAARGDDGSPCRGSTSRLAARAQKRPRRAGSYTRAPSVRASTAIRVAAATALAAGVAAPLLRRRLKLKPPVVAVTAGMAPFAFCVLVPRSRARDVATVLLQMWAYLALYKMPADDPEALEARVYVDYPVTIDRAIGRGTPPTLRLQRALGSRDGSFARWEKALVWSHWLWFAFPHGTAAFLLLRHRDGFPAGAARIYATFDLGLIGYWAVPTAPPWYAARKGLMEDGRTPEVRRMMVEYGEQFWRTRWAPLYGVLGGNPLAAMPSLHFATSVTAAHELASTGRTAGILGWTYALTLGVALVYLGEHYVVDLLAGLGLAEGIRYASPRVEPLAERISGAVRALEARARG
jgi:membrane-associated phospholipid phosphatase